MSKRIVADQIVVFSGAFLGNMDFRNVNLTITNHDIFKVPEDCQQVDDWVSIMVVLHGSSQLHTLFSCRRSVGVQRLLPRAKNSLRGAKFQVKPDISN